MGKEGLKKYKMLEYFKTGEGKYWTHWQWYKEVFNQIIFKFFASFVSFLPLVAEVFNPKNKEGATLNIEAQLKNVIAWQPLWFASILYIGAYILYIVFCPKYIKEYNNYKSYKDFLHSPRWIVWLSQKIILDKKEFKKFMDRLATKKYLKQIPVNTTIDNGIVVDTDQTILTLTFENKKYQIAMPILSDGILDKEATENAEREIFWEIFGRYSSKFPVIRGLMITMLTISALLCAYVVVDYLYLMSKVIFHH